MREGVCACVKGREREWESVYVNKAKCVSHTGAAVQKTGQAAERAKELGKYIQNCMYA